MTHIRLYSNTNSITNVPNVFIDEYMAVADGDAVKLYLFLLRKCSAGESFFRTSDILNKFVFTEKELWHAIRYLEEVGLIHTRRGSDNEIISVYMNECLPVAVKQNGSNELLDEQCDGTELSNKEKMNKVFVSAEKCLGRKLSIREISSIVYWNDGLRLSPELIQYCIEYCILNGHPNTSYMEKVAVFWSKNNLTTIAAVEKENQDYYAYSNTVKKALGISGRNLSTGELAFIEKWRKEMKFPCEMIQVACEKTLKMIGKPSFPYVNSILKKWIKKEVKNLDDIQKEDAAHNERRFKYSRPKVKSNSFNNFNQRAYDNVELERYYFCDGEFPKAIRS